MEYITDLWNLIDFTSNSFFLAWIFLRAVAWFIVQVKQFKKKIGEILKKQNSIFVSRLTLTYERSLKKLCFKIVHD